MNKLAKRFKEISKSFNNIIRFNTNIINGIVGFITLLFFSKIIIILESE